MPEVIYLAKKRDRQREKTRVAINKKTDEYNTVISSLQQNIDDISSAFEVYVQQTNDTIASLETKIEVLNKNEYSKEYLTFEALEHTDITLSVILQISLLNILLISLHGLRLLLRLVLKQ